MGKWKETVGAGFGTARKAGQKREHVVIDDRDGSVGGKHIEHWDGSQDAVINVKPVGVGVSVNGKERVK